MELYVTLSAPPTSSLSIVSVRKTPCISCIQTSCCMYCLCQQQEHYMGTWALHGYMGTGGWVDWFGTHKHKLWPQHYTTQRVFTDRIHLLKFNIKEIGSLLKLCLCMCVDLCRYHPQYLATLKLLPHQIKSRCGEISRKYGTIVITDMTKHYFHKGIWNYNRYIIIYV